MTLHLDADVDIEANLDVSDAELTALALAADPDQPLDPQAVPFGDPELPGLLPAWYMPVPMARATGRVQRLLVGGIIVALLAVSSAGLCVTYGYPKIAW